MLLRSSVLTELDWRGRATSTGRTLLFLGLLAIVATFLMTFLAAKPAHAFSIFTVNSTGDGSDVNINDDVCDGDARPLVVRCTLRAAIQEANNTAGRDEIQFEIGGASATGVKTISPGSGGLDPITEQVAMNGYSQPGASANTARKGTNAVLNIQLSGTNAGAGARGLIINASNCLIRGLVINNFTSSDGISLSGTGNKVEGNFIGTDPQGVQDLGNLTGVFINSGSDNTIGGTDADDSVADGIIAARNLISGNSTGIRFNASGNAVEGNLIGTTANGRDARGNLSGVLLAASNNTVGDVGGTTGGAPNTIAFNEAGVGVIFNSSIANRIQRNSIFSNGGLGIDLVGGNEDPSGATANDGGAANDSDTGPNGLQNKPELTLATTDGTAVTIEGQLDTKPSTTFTVEFFSQGGGNEGKKFIGRKQVSTNSNGLDLFSFSFSKAVDADQKITATATGPEGTSEFSAPVQAAAST